MPKVKLKSGNRNTAISRKAVQSAVDSAYNTNVDSRSKPYARVFISKGSGNITVNDKDYKTYLQNQVDRPLRTIEAADKFDVKINTVGGGIKSQAEVAMLSIARALVEINAAFRPSLKAAGLLKPKPRSVERKKFGEKKTRRSYQFSKR